MLMVEIMADIIEVIAIDTTEKIIITHSNVIIIGVKEMVSDKIGEIIVEI